MPPAHRHIEKGLCWDPVGALTGHLPILSSLRSLRCFRQLWQRFSKQALLPRHSQHASGAEGVSCTPALTPSFSRGDKNKDLYYFPSSVWKTHPRTTSPKQHQSSGKQKEVKGKLFIAKTSSFAVKYCLISSLRHLLSHSPYYFSSYYCLIFPIQKVRTDTSQFPSWHNCL